METLTFYFDRCFGKRFPETLKRANPPFAVEYQNKSPFKQDARDDDWLSYAGQKKWIVFSHDRKFHSESMEAAAIKQHEVACFYLPGADATTWNKLRYFIVAYPNICRVVQNENKPYIYQVLHTGNLKQIPFPWQ